MYRTSLILATLVAACALNSCEPLPPMEPSAMERHETETNIAREQHRLNREADAARDRAEELDTASRMMGRGAAN